MSRANMIQKMGRESLLAFCISQSENFETPAHIRQIAEKLEAVERGEINRLMIFMPPRHGKSHLATENYPAWFLGRNPDKNVILASYGQNLANDFGRKVKNKIESPIYREIFSDVQLSKDSKSKSQFSLTTGGSYFAVGVGGAITGRGGDLIICDDLIKNSDEARSTTYQNSQREWYQTTLRTRLMPGGAIVLIMTRWSDKDIASWILENDDEGEWEVLSLPAISEDGKALWPERYPIDELHRLKKQLGSKNFSSLYQQQPSPDEGNVIKRNWIKYYRKVPEFIGRTVISVDTTFTDRPTSDNCAICVLGRSRSSENIYVLDFKVDKMNFVKALENIKKMKEKFPKATVVIEKSANGEALIETLRTNTSDVIGVSPKGSKVSRILNVAPSIEAGQVFFPSPDIRFDVSDQIEELVTFPDGKHDDFCDSLSQGILRLRSTFHEKFIDDLIKNYDEFGNPIDEKPKKLDIREQMWPDVDWKAEDNHEPRLDNGGQWDWIGF